MSSPILISQGRVPFEHAQSVQLQCPHCKVFCEAVFPWNATEAQKIKIRHDVITDHARVCTVATAEVGRIWTVEPPRA